MRPNPEEILDAAFVEKWSLQYPKDYDLKYYDPYIAAGRQGDACALRKLTEWKNVGLGQRPMRLAKTKEISFQKFVQNLDSFKGKEGRKALRLSFPKNAPIYSIFWYHVLFGSPIFDRHTNRAYQWFACHKYLDGSKARVRPGGGHWELYFAYEDWFTKTLRNARQTNSSLSERDLDRALFIWGKRHQ